MNVVPRPRAAYAFPLPPLLLACALAGCTGTSKVPLSSPDEAQVDTSLLGLWLPVGDSIANPLLILAFSEREYLVEELPCQSLVAAVDEPADRVPNLWNPLALAVIIFHSRGHVTDVNGARFLNLQYVGTSTRHRVYRFARYRLLPDGALELRRVLLTPPESVAATSGELFRWMSANVAADSIYEPAPVVYRKVTDEPGPEQVSSSGSTVKAAGEGSLAQNRRCRSGCLPALC